MEKQKILITGISGLLGSTLKIVLSSQGNLVSEFKGDISDTGAVGNFCAQEHYDWVIHTAAVTDVNLCENDRDLCYRVNFEGTKNIRDLAKSMGSKFLYISTVSVFSGVEGNYKETDIPYPGNFYNLTKLSGEQATLEYQNGYVLRLNLIGIHPDGSRGLNFFEWLLDSLINSRDINLFSDVMINPLSNWTIAEMIEKLIQTRDCPRIIHIASSNALSKAGIGEFVAKKFNNYSGKIKLISVDEAGAAAPRPKQIWLNSDLAKEKLGLAMPTLEQEIEKIFRKSGLAKK